MLLEVLYQDEYMVAINKPPGLLVHRTNLDKYATEFAVQILRDQIGKRVSPVHRIDRKTSGVLLFSLNNEVHRHLAEQFEEGDIQKEYTTVLRGYIDQENRIDYALTNENGKVQDAITDYELIQHYEIPVAFGRHNTSRYSLVKAYPRTGRFHQLRKHFAHVLHPIIGDRPHGCNKQNRFFKEKWGMTSMLLSATKLTLIHPVTGFRIEINSDVSNTLRQTVRLFENLSR